MSSKRHRGQEKVRAKKKLLLLKTSEKCHKINDFFSNKKKSEIIELIADESIKSCSLSSIKNNILIHVDDPITPFHLID